MRIDKFLCEMEIGTRSQVKEAIKKKQVMVNGVLIQKSDIQIDPKEDKVCYKGEELTYQKYIYYMLNKPMGVVSACKDNTCETVMDLLEVARKKDLFPIGRLDKDTEGLLLITNDGDLAHRLLAPGKHVDKRYLVGLNHPLTQHDVELLEQGVDIGDDKRTMPANVNIISDCTIELTIREGRFHQVKRMLKAVSNEVTTLKRVYFGGISLDLDLKPGEYRELTQEEVLKLKNQKEKTD